MSSSLEQTSTERSLAAITWLKTFLTNNSSASEAKRLTSGLDPSAATIQTIERLRDTITKRTRSLNATLTEATKRASEYEALRKSWDIESVKKLYENLHPDAISETVQLAQICSALEVSGTAREDRLVGLTEAATRYLSMRDVVASRRAALAEARMRLQEAAWHLGQARETQKEAEISVRERKEGARAGRGKAGRMAEKAGYYEERALEVREEVRESGVSISTTHEVVSGRIEELKKVERRLEEVRGKVEKYRGLPADMDAAREKVDRVKKEIVEIEDEIQAAISSMV